MASSTTSFARGAQFPAELVDSVIDHNHDDPATLKVCALVARQWTASSRFHLFHRVVIHHDNAREFIQLLSSPHCTVASAVRDLAVQFVPGSQRWFTEFSRRLFLLEKTTNISSLDILGSLGTVVREEAQAALSHFSGQIRSLNFGPVVFEAFIDFARLLCTFRSLQSLSCACTFQVDAVDQEEIRGARLQVAGTLHQFKLISPSIKPVLEFLLQQEEGGGSAILPTVANLSLSYLSVEDYPPLTTYLGTPNDNLQSLTIRMNNNFSGANLDALAENLKLTQLRALANLTVETVPLLAPDQAVRLLGSITSQQFTSLKISAALVQGVARLDILLCSDQFSALQTVKIIGSNWDDVRQFLPRCDLKGILRET